MGWVCEKHDTGSVGPDQCWRCLQQKLDVQQDETKRLRWERDLLALNVRNLPNRIAVVYANDQIMGVLLRPGTGADDLVTEPQPALEKAEVG